MKLSPIDVKRRILYKMARKNLWGGKHTAYDEMWKRGLPQEHWADFRHELDNLIKEGFVAKKPTGYGMHISLNVRMKAEIEKIIFE
ncbi:MAG TPA: hypothetical protein VJH23_03715 [archaeon]|nr:hypothetical protein [archaeon]